MELRALNRDFYERKTVTVAKELLSKLLVRVINNKLLVGKIVEVEAYGGNDDPASHAYRGLTKRNAVMFGKPGLAYVYKIYGMYYCLNVVTEKESIPGAVLIRALEPIKGIDEMMKNRRTKNLIDLTNGPAKLTKAMNIDMKFYGWDLTIGKKLFIAKDKSLSQDLEIVATSRVGIKVGLDKKWRFYIKGNRFVSVI